MFLEDELVKFSINSVMTQRGAFGDENLHIPSCREQQQQNKNASHSRKRSPFSHPVPKRSGNMLFAIQSAILDHVSTLAHVESTKAISRVPYPRSNGASPA